MNIRIEKVRNRYIEIPADKVESVKQKIHEELQHALKAGYKYFFVGFTGEASLLFLETAPPFREQYPDISIDVMIPHKEWVDEQKEKDRYYRALVQTNGYKMCNQDYGDNIFIVNNQLLDLCSRLIAIHDGQNTDTKQVVGLAKEMEQEAREILL